MSDATRHPTSPKPKEATLAVRRRLRNELLVGSFVLLGMVLFALLLFFMGTLNPFLSDSAIVEARFENTQGLQSGDPVLLFGMRVGKVQDIELLQRRGLEPAELAVRFTLPAKYRSYLRSDSIARIDKTLTGNISLIILDGVGPRLRPNGILQGEPAADLATVADQVEVALQQGQTLLERLSAMVDDLQRDGVLLNGVREFAALAESARASVTPLRQDLGDVLKSANEVLRDNRDNVRETLAQLRHGTELFNRFTEQLQTVPGSFERCLAQLEAAGNKASQTLTANRPHLEAILVDLRQTSANAANLTAEIKRRPWRLLHRPSRSEEESIDLYDAAWAYNLGASELNRSIQELASMLELAEDGEVPAAHFEQLYAKVHSSLARQREAEEVFWAKLQD